MGYKKAFPQIVTYILQKAFLNMLWHIVAYKKSKTVKIIHSCAIVINHK